MKTTQCKYLNRKYGKGFILSGESGLKSIADCDIDYLPFTSWDGAHDPEKDVYSFRGIVRMMSSPEFKAQGYNWICLDSLTELSDRLFDSLEDKHKDNKNTFEKWGEYSRLLIGALKWIRDLPTHVLVTCLAAEETNDNGTTEYWPMVKGAKVGKQIPGLFDHVFCILMSTEGSPDDPVVKRRLITDKVRGWHGKTRDPRGRLKPIMNTADITELFDLMEMSDEQFAKTQTKKA
nr:AAA family ATPase [Endozoicomonas sp.]